MKKHLSSRQTKHVSTMLDKHKQNCTLIASQQLNAQRSHHPQHSVFYTKQHTHGGVHTACNQCWVIKTSPTAAVSHSMTLQHLSAHQPVLTLHTPHDLGLIAAQCLTEPHYRQTFQTHHCRSQRVQALSGRLNVCVARASSAPK